MPKLTTEKPDDHAHPPTILPGTKFLAYSGPGFVEIKPHTVSWIRAGLEQLAGYRATRPGKTPYLLTYTYRATPDRDTSVFTGYLLKPLGSVLDFAQARNKAKEDKKKPPAWYPVPKLGPAAWLGKLGPWWPLGTHPVPELTFGRWGEVAGPGAIGSMLEYPLRKKFLEMHVPKEDLTEKKASGGPGPDIVFLEVAEFLYELEAALGRAA